MPRAPRPPGFCGFFPALLALAVSTWAQDMRLANLATRGQTGTGSSMLTAGFVIGPGSAKQVLVRAVGPTLANFGLTGVILDPVLVLVDAAGTKVAENDNWLANDAPTMIAAGAFALPASSRDAALVVRLAPGAYTAQVSGAGGAVGLTLIEVYEVGAAGGRLINLSTRGPVGTGVNVMIPGIVVSPGSGTRRFLIRAAGPALGGFGLPGILADPTVLVTNAAGTLTYASNNDWGTPLGIGAATTEQLAAAFMQAGAFAFSAGSKDAALLVDLSAGSYTIQVSGANTTSGLALVEVYDVTPVGTAIISIAATQAAADKSGSRPGEFTFLRTGDNASALTVRYTVSGSAASGFDYPPLSGAVFFPAGASSVVLPLEPYPALLATGVQTAVLTLVPDGANYGVGSASSATVTIASSPATLYLTTLRPESTVSGSSASGTATILVNPSGTLALVNVAFSGLTSAVTGAHLKIGPRGDYVLNLPREEVVNRVWQFQPSGTYASVDLLDALKTGNIYVGLDTANFPAGEVRGTFLLASGAQGFVPPPPPPALPAGLPTAADAARLLTQATFGPRRGEISAVQAQAIGVWITAQLALPFTSHRAATLTDFHTFGGASSGYPSPDNRQAAWWKLSLTAPDQLRQRVAFALSQIFVVSDVGFEENHEALAHYYDLLGNGAFGNFRALLENVTLSPVMGRYLSSLRNAKTDPRAGTQPDENYAREVMQLFSVGLSLLQPDGTLKLDPGGRPIPTYSQDIVSDMARVFTGWAFASDQTIPSFRFEPADYFRPMQLYPGSHDDGVKTIINGVTLPPGQGGRKDLQQALDTLFFHPNTGPFLVKQLIQRLVTSNPTPAYVYRVAEMFADNGAGVRGDLAAVVRVILTDFDARATATAAAADFGKLKEPILRATGLLRAFGASSVSGRFSFNLTQTQEPLAQAALRSPTVFNFFRPDYVLPGPLAAAGLVAPEFEITDTAHAVSSLNFLRGFCFNARDSNPDTLVLDLAYEQSLAATPAALLDHLGLVMTGGILPTATRDRVMAMLAALPTSTPALERAQRAILVLATSPAGATQK